MSWISGRLGKSIFSSLLLTAGAVVPGAALFGALSLDAQTVPLPAITKMPPSVPYRWRNVVIKGGGFVSGLVFSTTRKGLFYARTDVGGAYRSDNAGETWIPLTDQFGREESSYLGIESLALDPNDGNKLYMAAGMYSADWGGPAAIFRSNDQGRTWQKTPMPFKMGGNDDGRGVGERLAVDPNLGSILYFGSRKAGLWKSVDAGVTWAHVDSFPVQAKVPGVGEKTGITFVVFDPSSAQKGEATKTIYAGVAQSGASLYRSVDGGATWALIPGGPATLFPNHAAVNPGVAVYFTYVDNIGPNGIGDGAVQRFTPDGNRWKDITPLRPGGEGAGKFGYGGLAIDLEHPETVMVTTIDRWYPGDTIFRTTDGGKNWKDVKSTAVFSAKTTPWVYWHRPATGGTGWMAGIAIDPFNPDKVIYTTGEGLWGTANVTALDAGKPTFWGFPDENLEETVPLGIVSPSEGAHLISVLGDIGGYRHEDLEKSPEYGFFTDPALNTTTALDMAGLAPKILVRAGYGGGKGVHGGYTLDNGLTWKPLASEPPAMGNGGGTMALSADGKTVVWIAPKAAATWSADWGAHWALCNGLTDKMRVYADRVNPLKFYSFDPDSGKLLVSEDGARSFQARGEPIAPRSGNALIAPVPGMEGDLWIAAGRHIFHSSDSGKTFVQLEGMDDAFTIGFGMAAAGAKVPAIFINGSVGKVEGTFRSVDFGRSWVRVDDPRHQYGWKNAIAGDPRVFGRVYYATGGRGIVYGDPILPAGGHAPATGQ
jgi:photosystem II stability/assembly factor-like uncharacterized protein